MSCGFCEFCLHLKILLLRGSVSKTSAEGWAGVEPFFETVPCEMVVGGKISRVNDWPMSAGYSSTFVLPVSCRYLNAFLSFHML